MSPAFMEVAGNGIARTPMEHAAAEAGARFEVRDGWNLAVSYGSPDAEAVACAETVGWADVSHLRKLEIQGDVGELELGVATRADGAWWCPLTARRALVIEATAEPDGRSALDVERAATARDGRSVLDVTTVFAAITLVGPLAREVFARFCALDLREAATPVRGFRPGSIARQPGMILREDEDRFLFLFGWGIGHYVWQQVADAGFHLGGRPVGLDALAALRAPAREAAASA